MIVSSTPDNGRESISWKMVVKDTDYIEYTSRQTGIKLAQ